MEARLLLFLCLLAATGLAQAIDHVADQAEGVAENEVADEQESDHSDQFHSPAGELDQDANDDDDDDDEPELGPDGQMEKYKRPLCERILKSIGLGGLVDMSYRRKYRELNKWLEMDVADASDVAANLAAAHQRLVRPPPEESREELKKWREFRQTLAHFTDLMKLDGSDENLCSPQSIEILEFNNRATNKLLNRQSVGARAKQPGQLNRVERVVLAYGQRHYLACANFLKAKYWRTAQLQLSAEVQATLSDFFEPMLAAHFVKNKLVAPDYDAVRPLDYIRDNRRGLFLFLEHQFGQLKGESDAQILYKSLHSLAAAQRDQTTLEALERLAPGSSGRGAADSQAIRAAFDSYMVAACQSVGALDHLFDVIRYDVRIAPAHELARMFTSSPQDQAFLKLLNYAVFCEKFQRARKHLRRDLIKFATKVARMAAAGPNAVPV